MTRVNLEEISSSWSIQKENELSKLAGSTEKKLISAVDELKSAIFKSSLMEVAREKLKLRLFDEIQNLIKDK